MATAVRTTATTRVPMDALRKSALVAGLFYLLTFLSIPTLFLYDQVRNNREYILGPGPDTAVLVGGILEIIVALAGVGTAVALYPVLKRQSEGRALGFVGSRVLEGAGLLAGVACLLAIVSLRQAGAGAGALVAGQTLAILYDRIFLLSQDLMPPLNAVLLGSLLYQSRLVPRALPLLAFCGAALLIVGDIGTLFSFWGPTSAPALFLAIPIALWEFSLGVYLVVKGFKPSPILSSDPSDAGLNRSPAPADVTR